MVIHAPTPAKLLNDIHEKHTLVIGQEHRLEIAEEYPCTEHLEMFTVNSWGSRGGGGVHGPGPPKF